MQIGKTENKPISGDLIGNIRRLIETARHNVAVNAGLTILYWQIGDRIRQDILKEKNLRRMIQFAEVLSDKEIVVSLIRQLSWTHFIALIPLKDDLQRDFCAEMCRVAVGWQNVGLYACPYSQTF